MLDTVNKKGGSRFLKAFIWASLAVLCFFVKSSWAVQTLGTIATGLTSSFAGIAKLITGASYLAGIGIALGAIL